MARLVVASCSSRCSDILVLSPASCCTTRSPRAPTVTVLCSLNFWPTRPKFRRASSVASMDVCTTCCTTKVGAVFCCCAVLVSSSAHWRLRLSRLVCCCTILILFYFFFYCRRRLHCGCDAQARGAGADRARGGAQSLAPLCTRADVPVVVGSTDGDPRAALYGCTCHIFFFIFIIDSRYSSEAPRDALINDNAPLQKEVASFGNAKPG